MKRWKWLVLVLMFLFLLTNCAAVGRGLKQGWKDFYAYVPIPSPQPGLVLPINRSPAVWAECWLFEGRFSQKELIIPHPTKRGQLTFIKRPLKHFIVNPPKSQPYKGNVISTAITVPLLLPVYPADYTLLVFHQNFLGTVVKMEVKRFSITGYAFNNYYLSGGRKIYADKVIKLARVKPYQHQQFKFHRTYYPGHALKDALSLP